MKKVIQRLACFLGIAAVLCAGIYACMDDDNAQEETQVGSTEAAYGKTIILYTNNTDIMADGLEWIQKAGDLKRYFEEDGATVYLLDAGNVFFNAETEERPSLQPALPDLQAKSTEYVIGLLNEAGYDGVLPGSRDLSNGAEDLQEKLRQSRIPQEFVVFCSNMQCKLCGDSIFSESGIIADEDTLTGFMGIMDKSREEENINVSDPQRTAEENIRDFRSCANMQEKTLSEVIAVLQLGPEGDAGNAVRDFVDKNDEVTVIIDGNCEKQYDPDSNTDRKDYVVSGIGSQPEGIGYIKIWPGVNKIMETEIIDENRYEDLMEEAARVG